MNEALKEIANRYEVAEDKISEILEKLPVKNPEKPTKKQIQGFEKVCTLIKEGKSTEEAIEIVVREAKNGTKELMPDSLIEDEELDNFIIEQAIRAADATISSLPQVAFDECQRLKESFVRKYRERIAERLNDPEFKQQFVATIEGKEMGKFIFSNSTHSTIALPSSSSSNS
jgi:uncharacterized protein YoaH (UPF0181 family)